MSVFIKKSCCSDRLLERIMDALADLMNLTRMDLGQHCCIWLEFLNFPRQKWFLMHWGWIELSVSTLEMTVIMFFKSPLKHSSLGVPFGHSSMPQLNNNVELFVRLARMLELGISALLLSVLRHWGQKKGFLGWEGRSKARQGTLRQIRSWCGYCRSF